MAKLDRRSFIATIGATLGTAAVGLEETAEGPSPRANMSPTDLEESTDIFSVDFRYAPSDWQSVFCFPDDPHKGVVGRSGELRYGHPGTYAKELQYFRETVHFSLGGMNVPRVLDQSLEAPGLPIVHTRIEQAQAFMELTTFATNEGNEGRVDNVLIEVRPKSANRVLARVVIYLDTVLPVAGRLSGSSRLFYVGDEPAPLFMAADSPLFGAHDLKLEDTGHGYRLSKDTGHGCLIEFPQDEASTEKPARYFLRFPQEGQPFERIKDNLATPEHLLAGVRTYWHEWRPFHGEVTWQLPSPYQEFLLGCTRNLMQCRDRRNNFQVFLVGPTIYHDFAIVDLHFILEAARYLGYDAEARENLEASWAAQTQEGAIFANAGAQHWKDTGIAPFTIVRQAELSQDWSYFRAMQPKIVQAFAFIGSLREKAKSEGGPNGRYGLLPRGYGDGGIGIRDELTNTVWVLAGMNLVLEAADRLGMTGYEAAKELYADLRQCFLAAAQQEMRRHPDGFQYLPMLMKEDPQWAAAAVFDRPRPQTGQWALSHAIYPGLLFDKDDPIVTGHIDLMQSCTQEDIPAETGYVAYEGLWPYNASLVAHVYLWAGLPDWANQVFQGFLNHACPMYCWREEQPLQESAAAHYIGDMPHNWASAEVIRYLRHMLALEVGTSLRLLNGIRAAQLAPEEAWRIAGSPTKFGRLSMALAPIHDGWQLTFARGPGPDPAEVLLPATLGDAYHFAGISAGTARPSGKELMISPQVNKWVATWKI